MVKSTWRTNGRKVLLLFQKMKKMMPLLNFQRSIQSKPISLVSRAKMKKRKKRKKLKKQEKNPQFSILSFKQQMNQNLRRNVQSLETVKFLDCKKISKEIKKKKKKEKQRAFKEQWTKNGKRKHQDPLKLTPAHIEEQQKHPPLLLLLQLRLELDRWTLVINICENT